MLSKGRPDMIAVGSQVLKSMEAFSKEISKLESGKAAEAFLAVLYSGGVSGGANGAADMIAGTTDKKVLLSLKIYSQLGGTAGVKQKEGDLLSTGKGIYAATQKGIVYYVIGLRKYYDPSFPRRRDATTLKVGSAITDLPKGITAAEFKAAGAKTPDKTASILFLTVGVGKRKLDSGRYPIFNPAGIEISEAIVSGDRNVLIGDAIEGKDLTGLTLGEVPLFYGDEASIGMNSLDDMLNRAVDNLKEKTLTAIRDIYRKLQALDNDTKRYTGDQERPPDAAKGIRTNYTGIKADFNQVLGMFGGEQEKIKENKINKEKLLDKLIQDVILNK